MIPKFAFTLISVSALALGVPALAQQVPLKDPIPFPIPQSPIGVTLKPVALGLTSPIFLAQEGDRKFVVDQTGLVLLLNDEGDASTVFLDITGVVAQISPAFPSAPQGLNPGYDERGLLGQAFHPRFQDKHHPGYHTFYTLHNVPVTRHADFPEPPFPDPRTPNIAPVPNCQEVIAEWKVDHSNPDVTDPNSYREVLRFDKPQFNHNGGSVAFGPDGLLYSAFGDGGAANDVGAGHNPLTGNAQDLSTILGKMIRINPLDPSLTSDLHGAVSDNGRYRIPRGNPFFGKTGVRAEIWAYGLRNPYRFSFDARDGRLVLADVGQNNIEEVDIITPGGNFGWRFKEGTFLFAATGPNRGSVFTDPNPDPTLINPVLEYDHFEATAKRITRIAIVGGFVYRGSRIHDLRGKYVCGDLKGFLFAGDLNSGKIEQLLDTGMFIKGFGQDEDGELYVTGSKIIGPGVAGSTNGLVLKIRPARNDKGGED